MRFNGKQFNAFARLALMMFRIMRAQVFDHNQFQLATLIDQYFATADRHDWRATFKVVKTFAAYVENPSYRETVSAGVLIAFDQRCNDFLKAYETEAV